MMEVPPDAEAAAELSTCAELEELDVALLVVVWAPAEDADIADAVMMSTAAQTTKLTFILQVFKPANAPKSVPRNRPQKPCRRSSAAICSREVTSRVGKAAK
ncbi:hypothetical protein A7A09_013335 [Paracoccus methylarcula]|uniref:Uncharacterized protein n=1 Tax=Paracoccus methylarcula TaxID=72022 RepID=A0A3R7LJC3_9RHOB|nr:hypothetical protein A7A09_013335 [Paracoccus methylarcula]